MANVLGNLIVQLTAQTDAFARGMSDAKKLAFTTSGEIVDSLKKVGDQLGRLKFGSTAEWEKSGAIIGGVLAGIGAAVVTSSVVVAKEVAEQAKQMGKLAQSYGLSIEQVSQLRVASKLTGVEMETLTMGLGRLAKASASAAEGGKMQQQAFAALGVAFDDGAGHLRPMQQLLPDIAEKFSKMETGTGKTALAMQLFGRSGAQLIPVLNQGADGIRKMNELSDQLGLTWSEKDIEAAEAFQQRIELMDLKSTALKENFVKGLLPALDSISSAFISTSATGKSAAEVLGESVGTALKYTVVGVASLVAEWRELLVVMDLRKWGKEAQDQFDAIEGNFQKMAHEVLAPPSQGPLFPGLKGGAAGTTPTIGGGAGKAGDDGLSKLLDQARQTYDKTISNSLATQISSIEALKVKLQQFAASHPEKIFLDINAAVEKLNLAEGELIAKYQGALQSELNKGLATQIGSVLSAQSSIPSASGQVQAQSDFINLTKDLNEQNRLRMQVFDQTRTPLERYIADVQTLDLLYKDKSSDEYQRSLRDANERLTEAYNPAIKLQKAIEDLNDAYRVGAITLGQYQQQLRELQAQQALAATVTNPQSGLAGIKQGVNAGVLTLGAEWKGLSAEIAQSTINIGHSISENMGRAITDMVLGTKTVGQAFEEMGRDILASIVQTCAQMLAQWITTHLIMAAISRVFGVGGNPAGQQATKTGVANVGMAQSYAGLAAAEAFAYYMPEGLWTALAMAGIADGIGQTFVAQAGAAFAGAARGGALLSEDSIIAAGADEMVLPVNLSKGLQGMITAFNGQTQGGGYRATGRSGDSYASYGGHTINQHIYGGNADPEEIANMAVAKVKTFFRTGGVVR